jgi:hypothetical protein
MSFLPPKQKRERKKFSQEEDEIILNFVQENGYEKIKDLTSQIPNRTARQIRERYRLYLDQSVSQFSFSKEEDINLVNYVQKFGKKWSIIATLMKGRKDVQLKYRYRKLWKRGFVFQVLNQTNVQSSYKEDKRLSQDSPLIILQNDSQHFDSNQFFQLISNPDSIHLSEQRNEKTVTTKTEDLFSFFDPSFLDSYQSLFEDFN